MSMSIESAVIGPRKDRSLPMADERVITQRAKAERAAVLSVEPGKAGARAGIEIGDVLVAIDGVHILDIVDYQFQTAGELITVEMLRGKQSLTFEIEKGYDEPLGIEFADDLFDRVHICKNKCVFCFLYQQPKGLRPSLYIKDDDYRLSFLHGNYLTLTNMDEAEFKRVIDQKLSPLFVSVHATDPDIRAKMLGRDASTPILPRLEMLADAKIQVHGQVVLCPGYNDGAVLDKTISDLAKLHPEVRGTYGGVLSVAVVPVGLTQFRDRQAALTTCTTEFTRSLVAQAQKWREEYRHTLGTNFVFLSDEIYLSADAELPSTQSYEGFPQLEDGVGLVRQFIDDLEQTRKRLPKSVSKPVTATLVTGELAAPLIQGLASSLSKVGNVEVNTATVHNRFFEGNISVAGLLTGRDIVDHLLGMGGSLGERVIVPSIMLRDPDRDIFLDDMTLSQFSEAIDRDVRVVERLPGAAALAVLS